MESNEPVNVQIADVARFLMSANNDMFLEAFSESGTYWNSVQCLEDGFRIFRCELVPESYDKDYLAKWILELPDGFDLTVEDDEFIAVKEENVSLTAAEIAHHRAVVERLGPLYGMPKNKGQTLKWRRCKPLTGVESDRLETTR